MRDIFTNDVYASQYQSFTYSFGLNTFHNQTTSEITFRHFCMLTIFLLFLASPIRLIEMATEIPAEELVDIRTLNFGTVSRVDVCLWNFSRAVVKKKLLLGDHIR